jgi:hypothetical protein
MNHRVRPMTGYVTRLRDRMQQRAWAADDPLYVGVKAAQDALHRLHMALRELSRLRTVASHERRTWEPRGSVRGGR